jgi:hypothetical protein
MGTGSFPRRPRRDADHTPPSSAEVKKELSYTSTYPTGPSGPVTGFPLSFTFTPSNSATAILSHTLTSHVLGVGCQKDLKENPEFSPVCSVRWSLNIKFSANIIYTYIYTRAILEKSEKNITKNAVNILQFAWAQHFQGQQWISVSPLRARVRACARARARPASPFTIHWSPSMTLA